MTARNPTTFVFVVKSGEVVLGVFTTFAQVKRFCKVSQIYHSVQILRRKVKLFIDEPSVPPLQREQCKTKTQKQKKTGVKIDLRLVG